MSIRWGHPHEAVFEFRGEIVNFMKKWKPVVQLQIPEWLQDFAFAVDIADHLSDLNIMSQGRSTVVTQFYYKIQVFKSKFALWEMQLSSNNPVHFYV